MNELKLANYMTRMTGPRYFRHHNSIVWHTALLAFPSTSQTLCGLAITSLELVPEGEPYQLLCVKCHHRAAELLRNVKRRAKAQIVNS